MNKLRVFEAFAGIGTQRMALKRLGINHEVIGISEIDKFAIKSYEAIHGETKNFGDISKLDTKDLPDFDLFTYSFPCQDISAAGHQKGLDKGSETRSSLLWECERIIKDCRPKYLLMENVKNLVGKRHIHNFEKWLETLEKYGYINSWQVLNAKDYGIPQNRERVFVVSILGNHEPYKFPEPVELELRLKDVLEDEVDEKFYLSEEKTQQLVTTISKKRSEQTAVKMNRNEVVIGASRGRNPKNPSDRTVGVKTEQRLEINKKGTSNTITTVQKDNLVVEARSDGGIRTKDAGGDKMVIEPKGAVKEATKKGYDYRIRKLIPLECWRLMGIDDEDFYKAQKVNSNTQLYKQAGNAIVVDVLEAIFKNLFVGD